MRKTMFALAAALALGAATISTGAMAAPRGGGFHGGGFHGGGHWAGGGHWGGGWRGGGWGPGVALGLGLGGLYAYGGYPYGYCGGYPYYYGGYNCGPYYYGW